MSEGETPSKIATQSTNRDVILDANVLVGLVDPRDTLHHKAVERLRHLQTAGGSAILVDFLVDEMLAVVLRRARERKQPGEGWEKVLLTVRHWREQGLVMSTAQGLEESWPEQLDILNESGARLNPNDAKLVLLLRDGPVRELATFDRALAEFLGVTCWAS